MHTLGKMSTHYSLDPYAKNLISSSVLFYILTRYQQKPGAFDLSVTANKTAPQEHPIIDSENTVKN